MLGIYTQYNDGELYMDATPFMYNLEFTTNENGFWYLSCNLHINKDVAADLYKARKIFHVWYGDGPNTFFEGRLEDVQYGNEIKITAYGYIRAFSDLQVNDLWSTQRYDLWHPLQSSQFPSNVLSNQWTYDQTNRVYIALNKNSSPPFAYSLGGFYFLGMQKSKRKLSYAEFTLNIVNKPLRLLYALLVTASGTTLGFKADSNAYFTNTTASGYITNVSKSYTAGDNLVFLAQYDASALYIGETGDVSMELTNVRIGTTPSISGARLYADEILKYTVSGVFALNPGQINPDMSAIRSPQTDLKEVIFEDITGKDVIDQLLMYTDSNGNFYECTVWEDQRVCFQPQKTYYNTWVVDIEDLTLVRTLEGTYNMIRTKYSKKIYAQGQVHFVPYTETQPNGRIRSGVRFVWDQIDTNVSDIKRTEFIPNQVSIDTLGIQRQTTVQIQTESESVAQAKAQKIADLRNSRALKTQIDVTYVLDEQDSRHDPRKVRSGDRIIIRNIPTALLDEVENTFFIKETKWNDDTKVMTITPAEPIDQLATIVGG